MPKITGGFSTKNKEEMLTKLKNAGVKIKLKLTASPELDVLKDPFEGFEVSDSKGKKQKIVKKTKAELKKKLVKIKEVIKPE